MNGTRFVTAGKGATVGQLDVALIEQRGAVGHPKAMEHIHYLYGLSDGPMIDVPTNLALTGAPLTAEDLARIAKCEVSNGR